MKQVVPIIALVLLLMSMMFLVSSHFVWVPILQLPPSTWPMPYRAALCILLTSLGFFTLLSRPALSKIIACAIILLASESIVHNSSKMVLIAACGFILTGVAFLCWKRVVAIFISSLIVFLGAIGIFTSLMSEPHLQGMLMHFYTSIGFLLIGIGFMIAKFQQKATSYLLNRRWFFRKDRL